MKNVPTKHQVNTKCPVKNDAASRLPHERDQAPDDQSIKPKKLIKQAYNDLRRGLVDTDMHGQRGVEDAVKHSTKVTRKKLAK